MSSISNISDEHCMKKCMKYCYKEKNMHIWIQKNMISERGNIEF